ncbi:hypothetical protein T484DRAFT_1781710, partial [Baffinella frigidus]
VSTLLLAAWARLGRIARAARGLNDSSNGEVLAAVLTLGGVLEVLSSRSAPASGADGPASGVAFEPFRPASGAAGGEGDLPFDREVVEGFLAAASEVLRGHARTLSGAPPYTTARGETRDRYLQREDVEEGYSEDTADAAMLQVLQSRVVKALWEVLAFPWVQHAAGRVPGLLPSLLALAQRPVQVPFSFRHKELQLNAGGDEAFSEGSPPEQVAAHLFDTSSAHTAASHLFDAASAQALSNVTVSADGAHVSMRDSNEGSVFVGPVLRPGSGQHYVEFQVMSLRGNYLFVGVASPNHDSTQAIGNRTQSIGNRANSWGWANDGDLMANGTWVGNGSKLASFHSGDYVGVIVNMDAANSDERPVLQYTFNGVLQHRFTRKLNCSTLRFAIGFSCTSCKIRIPEVSQRQYAFTPSATPVGPASGPAQWLTLEMLIAKSSFLALTAPPPSAPPG